MHILHCCSPVILLAIICPAVIQYLFCAYCSESVVLICQLIDMEEVFSSFNDVTRSFIHVSTGFNTFSSISCKLSCSKYFFKIIYSCIYRVQHFLFYKL